MKLAYSVAEVCAAANFGRTSLYAAIKAGALTTRKMGRRTIILREDLEKFLNSLPPTNARTPEGRAGADRADTR